MIFGAKHQNHQKRRNLTPTYYLRTTNLTNHPSRTHINTGTFEHRNTNALSIPAFIYTKDLHQY
jgi:hypothetical protein